MRKPSRLCSPSAAALARRRLRESDPSYAAREASLAIGRAKKRLDAVIDKHFSVGKEVSVRTVVGGQWQFFPAVVAGRMAESDAGLIVRIDSEPACLSMYRLRCCEPLYHVRWSAIDPIEALQRLREQAREFDAMKSQRSQ